MIVRDHVRLTIQPFDGPDDPAAVARLIDHMQSTRCCCFVRFSALAIRRRRHHAGGIPQKLHNRIWRDNALATYGVWPKPQSARPSAWRNT